MQPILTSPFCILLSLNLPALNKARCAILFMPMHTSVKEVNRNPRMSHHHTARNTQESIGSWVETTSLDGDYDFQCPFRVPAVDAKV